MLAMHQRRAQLGAGHAETQLEQAGAWCGRVDGVVALRGGPEHLWTNTTYRNRNRRVVLTVHVTRLVCRKSFFRDSFHRKLFTARFPQAHADTASQTQLFDR